MKTEQIKQEIEYTLCRLSFIKEISDTLYWFLLKDLVDFIGFCVNDIYLYIYKPSDFASVEYLESIQNKIMEYIQSDRFSKMREKNNIPLKIKNIGKKGA